MSTVSTSIIHCKLSYLNSLSPSFLNLRKTNFNGFKTLGSSVVKAYKSCYATAILNIFTVLKSLKISNTRMWANAQHDGRPTNYRWCPLFNAAKFGWRLLLECRAVTLPRRETRWHLQGCPKLANRSQPLVCRSSLYYEDMWRRYCCLTSFFPIVNTCLSCEHMTWQSCAMVPRWRFFASCIYSKLHAARFRPAS